MVRTPVGHGRRLAADRAIVSASESTFGFAPRRKRWSRGRAYALHGARAYSMSATQPACPDKLVGALNTFPLGFARQRKARALLFLKC